jgi:uncharacterized repeat protein (TIGR01451 family)
MTTFNRPGHGLVIVRSMQSWLLRSLVILVSLTGLGWSQHAAAITTGCEIQANGPTDQTGAVGSTLNYKFDIVDIGGGCPATVNGTIAAGPDGTGGASAPTTWSGSPGTTVSINVTLGSTGGGSINYTVDCPSDCFNGNTTIAWTARTGDVFTLTADPPTSVTILEGGAGATLNAHYFRNGVDNNDSTIWNSSPAGGFFSQSNPVFTDDSTGLVTNNFISFTPGVFNITVDGNPTECTSFCPPQINYTVTVEDLVMTTAQPASGNITIPQNSSTLLKIKYSGATIPVADGTNIDWTVTAEPVLGAGAFSPQDGGPPSFVRTKTTGGFAQTNFGVTVPGTYTVQAGYCPDGCNDTVTFTITVPATLADISITKTDSPDPVAPGGDLTYTITVNNAGPDPAAPIAMTDTLPAEVTFQSLAFPAPWNCTTPAVGSGGTITCTRAALPSGGSAVFTLGTKVLASVTSGTISNTATVQSTTSDPNPGNENATTTTGVSVVTGLTVNKVLTSTVDNDASTTISTGDQLNYSVTATNNGNSTLTNVVVTDDHFPGTTTCPSLVVGANCVLTGSYIVTAADATAGSVTNVGSATATQFTVPITSTVITGVSEAVTLAVGTGDGQSAPVNTAFALPLTVIAGGSIPPPPSLLPHHATASVVLTTPGVTINWTVQSGSALLSAPSSVTNASGVASINVTAGPVAGPIVIRATRADDPVVHADFHLTATTVQPLLTSLPGLTPAEKAVAEAIDEFCSSVGSSNPNSADLAARCQELINSIGSDPDGVIEALDQLFADIALIQSEAGLLAAESQFDNIKARIAALRSGTKGISFGGLALNGNSGRLPVGSMFQNMLSEDSPESKEKEVGTDFSRWGFFAAGTLGRGNADPGHVSPGYDFQINGFTAGADYRYSDKLIFGATLGYTKQNNDLVGHEGHLDTTGWSVSGYGTFYRSNSWYSDAVVSYGRNSYNTERHVHYTLNLPGGGTSVIDNVGRSDASGDSFTVAASFGRDFNKGGWGFGPYLRAMYTRLNFDPLTETFNAGPGSGLALEMDTRNVTSVSTTLGGKLTYAHSASWGVLMPHVQLEWQHEFKTDPSAVEAHFLYDPTATPFKVTGDPVDTDFFRFGIGMSFVMTHGRSGFFYYERLISRERFSQNSLAFGIRLEF